MANGPSGSGPIPANKTLEVRVGFIVTNLQQPSRAVVRFYNKRGTACSGSRKANKPRIGHDCPVIGFGANEVRLQLSVLAYNFGNLCGWCCQRGSTPGR